jgi:hypothetical protein
VHRFNCRVHRRCWNSLNTSKFLTPLTSFVIFEAIILDRQPIITVISWTLIDYPLAAYQFSWMDLSNGQLSLFSNHRQVSPKRESVDSPMHLELNRLTFLLWHLGIHSSLTISNLWVIWGTLHDKPLLVLPGTKLDYSLKSSQLNREFITFLPRWDEDIPNSSSYSTWWSVEEYSPWDGFNDCNLEPTILSY